MKRQLNRRRFLRGTGAVLIGLPLVEEFLPGSTQAQEAGVPRRVLTLSFGLGIERKLQAEGANGPLEPLMKYSDRMARFSNLHNGHLAGGGGTPHFRVAGTQFVGRKQESFSKAGGPSLEQLVKNRMHPNGVPTLTGVPSVSAGLWSRTGATTQFTRHWNADGSPGERPIRRPSTTFERIFEGFPAAGATPAKEVDTTDPQYVLEQHKQRSVLDTTKAQYEYLLGANSYLGKNSKERIDNHLQQIRQVEANLVNTDRVAAALEAVECGIPEEPIDPDISFYEAESGSTGGPELTWENGQAAFRANADLIALGMTCDALRFGSMIHYGAGGHMDLRGTYEAPSIGASITFREGSPHDNIFHSYNADSIRAFQHFSLSQLAYVLDLLDAVEEPNGKTVLDNTLIVIGTEYGRNHDTKGIFHAVLGGEGKFKPGTYDDEIPFEDLYVTLMEGYGIMDSEIPGNTISELLV